MSEEPQQLPPEPEPAREPFWSYHDLALFLAAAVVCLVFLGPAIVTLFFSGLHIKPAVNALTAVVGGTLGWTLLFWTLSLVFRTYDRPFWRSLAWVAPRQPPWQVAGAGFAAAMVVVLVGNAIHTPNTENEITKLMSDPASLVLMAIFGVLIAPVCEELAFRGFLQPLLVRSFGAVPGILGAAIPFGLLHFREYGNSWQHALLISLAGAAFGWMRHKSGSTLASAVMHASYNTLFFAAFLASRNAGKL
jgi:CAAX protease family protein